MEARPVASPKKRRKANKLTRQQMHPRTGPFRHADGDRRRRGGQTADQAIAEKRAMQQFGAIPPSMRDEEE
jgi:hypothetical protein